MKVQVIGNLVCFGEQGPSRVCGYPLRHIQTAIRRLHACKPFHLASPIYALSRKEVGTLLVNAEQILNYK